MQLEIALLKSAFIHLSYFSSAHNLIYDLTPKCTFVTLWEFKNNKNTTEKD